MNAHDERLHALAPYLLDALEPAERAEVTEHLQDCATCQAELASLAGLPGILARIDPADIDAHLEEPPAPLPLPVPPPRRRWELAAVAAAIVAVVGAGIGFASPHGGKEPTRVVNASSTAGVHAQFALAAKSWGTEISVRISGAPPGAHCVLTAFSHFGTSSPAGTWQAVYDGTATVTTATDMHLADVQSLELTTTGGQKLATARV